MRRSAEERGGARRSAEERGTRRHPPAAAHALAPIGDQSEEIVIEIPRILICDWSE